MTDLNPNAFDYAQFRVLLRAFFQLNTRGHLSRPYGQQGKSFHYLLTLFFYVMMGAFTGSMIFMVKDLAASLLVTHAMTFMFVMMIAILESSQVLFNPQEEDILGHRPISARTLLAAKVANMISITLTVALAFNVAPMFFILALPGVYAWAPLAHILTVVLMCIFCSAFVVFIYGVMTRLVGRERFQTLVTWCQIVMMVTATFGYQFIIRMQDLVNPQAIAQAIPFLALLPPTWFMGLEVSLASADPGLPMILFGAVALLLTPILAWVAVARLSGLQGRISGSLMEKQPVAPAAAAVRAPKPSAATLNPLLTAWLRDPVERGAFRLAGTVMRRERYIMQQLYPQLAFVVAYPLLMIMPVGGSHHGQHQQSFSAMGFICFALWMLGTLPMTALAILRTAENSEASTLFSIAPLEGAGRLFLGVRKAVLTYLVLPVTAVLLLVATLLLHLKPADALVAVPVLLVLPTFSLIPGLGRHPYLPLSVPAGRGDKSARVAGMFSSMLLIGVMIGISALFQYLGLIYWLIVAEVPLIVWLHHALLRVILRPSPIRIERAVE